MADDPKPPDDESAEQTPDDETAETKPSGDSATIKPAMNESEIRQAGLAIDVPYESGQSEPERLTYADLGQTWTPPDGWPPEQGQPQDEDDLNA